ncbi:MAG: hydantoinase B/oxoprolinase family protein [Thermoleophilia bacterium]
MSILEYEVGKKPGPPTRPRVEVDPVTLRVLGGAFHAVAKEMAGVLFRMSYSSIIRESEDLGAGIFDAEGREICESDTTPLHIGSLPWYIRGFMHRLAGKIQDGDVIVHNHPYLGASHTPDIAVAVPIFWEGELLGFSAVTAHVLDVGGSFPGINADAFDMYAEAKIYNGLRWYQGGVLNEDLDRMIFDNVRTETMNRGDFEAMLASCVLGKERFVRLLERYGVDVVMSAAYDWMDYSETMLRQEIARIPDGVYRAPTGWLDDDAVHRDTPLRVETAVIVEGDEITIDLTGSNPEVPTGYNVPFEGSLLVAAYFVIRTLMLDEALTPERIPQNDGIFRPVKVVAPKGTIYNPTFPRACFTRFCQIQRVIDNTILAVSDVIPEQVTAGNSAGIHFCSYSGFTRDTGEYWIYLEVNEGAYGGRFGKDALDSVDNLMVNTRNNPIEELDMRFPMRCDRYELRDEPSAPGRWRGGIGIVRENRFLTDGTYSSEGDRHKDAPRGIFGGHDGAVARVTRVHGGGTDEIPAKVTGVPCRPDDVVRIEVPNGAGYGDPLEREPDAVRDDVLDGFTTLALAHEAYGVAPHDARADGADARGRRCRDRGAPGRPGPRGLSRSAPGTQVPRLVAGVVALALGLVPTAAAAPATARASRSPVPRPCRRAAPSPCSPRGSRRGGRTRLGGRGRLAPDRGAARP